MNSYAALGSRGYFLLIQHQLLIPRIVAGRPSKQNHSTEPKSCLLWKANWGG